MKKERIVACPFCGYDKPKYLTNSKFTYSSLEDQIFKCPACHTVFRKVDGRTERLNEIVRALKFIKARAQRGESYEEIVESPDWLEQPLGSTYWIEELLLKSA